MRFDGHEPRSGRTFRERGFDFGDASRIWRGPVVEASDGRVDDAEARIKAIGCVDGRSHPVV